ncbi:MAG TPA: H-X9-DG-CTERM domain-containing protein [Chthoniobacteraceae bacterium]|nr:H-X9-DG-CTERM domain-containing protein [Chthoniobacteraceae bacterium]
MSPPNPFPPLPRPVAHQRRGGFSSVELLISIVVMALLATLALPAFRFVREQTNGTRCTGNLRIISTALHLYLAENNGEYPPNRRNFAHPLPNKGNPWVQDGLLPYLHANQSGTKTREAAGPWYCPSDTLRPMNVSAHSYGQNYYLGGDDRPTKDPAAHRPWWSKPAASPLSGQLIYLIDHDYLVEPKSTAGQFRSASWPLFGGIRVQPPTQPDGSYLVDFRHSGTANALFVDGSVRALKFEDLVNTKLKHLMVPD